MHGPYYPHIFPTGSCKLPTPWAIFELHGFVDESSGKEHVALSLGDFADEMPVLARIHSECLTGDALFSLRCDCGAQLDEALKRIAIEGRGVLLYLRQEGRGIGLINKIRSYRLQEQGVDTVEANTQLGFPADMRSYSLCRPILDYLGVISVRLMTNSPEKVSALISSGISVVDRIPLVVQSTGWNARYLETKREKLGHFYPVYDRA